MTQRVQPRAITGTRVATSMRLLNRELTPRWTAEPLALRPARAPDLAAENDALIRLCGALAVSPDAALRALTEAARVACRADAAGVVMHDAGGGAPLRCHLSGAGAEASADGVSAMACAGMACALLPTCEEPQLFVHAAGYAPSADPQWPQPQEALIAPLRFERKVIGSVWVLQQGSGRRFDCEDARLLQRLTRAVELDRPPDGIGDAHELERCLALLALRESELGNAVERLGAATQAARLGIQELDLRTGRLHWDARARAIWGVPASQPITRELVVDGIHPEDRARARAAWDGLLDAEGPGWREAEYRVIDRFGVQRWVRATGQVRFEGREPVGLIGTVQDISQEKALCLELEATERRKDAFLATLSHELRSPLAPIMTAGHLLGKNPDDAARVRWAAGIVQRQAAQMAALLDDLMDSARVTQGKLVLKPAPVALSTIIETAVETAGPVIAARKHQLTVELSTSNMVVDLDAVRIAQIVSNLLINAAKYTDSGGHIQLRVEANSRELQISVRDNGIGIPASALAGLFKMFSQIPGAQDRSQGGLGIGLALVKGLVDLHGGNVQAHSCGPGLGAEFLVRLPLAASAAGSATTAAATTASGHGNWPAEAVRA